MDIINMDIINILPKTPVLCSPLFGPLIISSPFPPLLLLVISSFGSLAGNTSPCPRCPTDPICYTDLPLVGLITNEYKTINCQCLGFLALTV